MAVARAAATFLSCMDAEEELNGQSDIGIPERTRMEDMRRALVALEKL